MVLRKIALCLLYARDYFRYAVVMSGITFYVFYELGLGALETIFWFKIITSAIGIWVHRNRKMPQIFFYLNNGLGPVPLISATLTFDMGIWIVGMRILLNGYL